MKITVCKYCKKELNVEFRDAYVCPYCDTLYQTTLDSYIENEILVEKVEVVNVMNGDIISIFFDAFDGIL